MTDDVSVFSAMQEEDPLVSYIKKVPSKVFVRLLNPFSGKEDGLILVGDPRVPDESCIVDIWTTKEDVFFRRQNKPLFDDGVLMSYKRTKEKVISEEEKYNTLSDEEMIELLNGKFFSLRAAVDKMTSQVPVYRMLKLAEELDKSEKITKFLQGKLASIELDSE